MKLKEVSFILNILKGSLSRIINAVLILFTASALMVALIVPVYYLAQQNRLFLNIPFLIMGALLMLYLAFGYLKSTIKRALFTSSLTLSTLFIPLTLVSNGQRIEFIFSALTWLLVSAIAITLAAATGPIREALSHRGDE